MTRRASDPFSTPKRQRATQKHETKRNQHRTSPCGGVPTKPATPVVFWGAVEKKTHLEFRIKARWTATTADTDGFPLDPSEYEAQAQAFKSDGTTAAETVTVGGKTKRASRKRKVQAPLSSEANPASGDATDWLMADFGNAVNPKSWKWSVRVRAANANGCYGEWSDWSTPELPSSADSDPLPPAPTILAMDFDTVGAGKYQKHRIKVRFRPIRKWDVPGGDTEDDLSTYVLQMQVQENGSGDWVKHAVHKIEDKDDEDASDVSNQPADGTKNLQAVSSVNVITNTFFRVQRGHKYRVRARSIDRFNRRGAWSDWFPSTSGTSKDATVDKPDAVTNLTKSRPAPRRIEWDWDDSQDAEFDRYKVVIAKADTTDGSFDWANPYRKVFIRHSHYRLAVAEDDKTKWFRARVTVQTAPKAGGSGEQSRVESAEVESGSEQPPASPSDAPATALEAIRQATMAYNTSTLVATVTCKGPLDFTDYDKTQITWYGSDTGLNGTLTALPDTVAAPNPEAKQAALSSDTLTFTRTLTATQVSSYPYLVAVLRHKAVPTGNHLNGPDYPQTLSTGGGTPPPAPGAVAQVVYATNPLSYNTSNGQATVRWYNATDMTDIANYRLTVQVQSAAGAAWVDILAGSVVVIADPVMTSYNQSRYLSATLPTPTAEKNQYAVRAIVTSLATTASGRANSAPLATNTVLLTGAPAPALPSAISIYSSSVSPTNAGVSQTVTVTGTSGYPNGSATNYDYIWLRTNNGTNPSSGSWATNPEAPGAGQGDTHVGLTSIPSNGATSGSTTRYTINAPYFNGQNELQQQWFKLYMRARNANNNTQTAWFGATTWNSITQGTPPAPPATTGTASKYFKDARGLFYFDIYQLPHDWDFRSSISPPTTSMGENDVAYYIQYAIGTSSTTAPTSGWTPSLGTEYFYQTSSALGVGVTYPSAALAGAYKFRLPHAATANGGGLSLTLGSTQYLWVRVRVRTVGNNGTDTSAATMMGTFSGTSSTSNTGFRTQVLTLGV